MAKFRNKSIFIVILALCMVLCLTLVACNDGNNKPADTAKYSVTVKIGETPQSGVKVTLSQGGVEIDETTGTDGKASFELAKGTYEVALSNLPAHYAVPSNATLTLTADNPDLVISLEEEFAYVVNLVNPDGSAFVKQNVFVGICTFAGNCHTPVALGNDGVAYLYDSKGDYHVKITGTGFSGYAYECDTEGYYTGKNFSATETEMTITVYPVEILSADNGADLTNEDRSKYYIDADATAYKFTKELKKGETAYFSFTADLTAQYGIYVDKQMDSATFSNRLEYYTMGAAFVLNGYRAIYNGEQPYEANKTYYYMAKNNSEETLTAEIIIVFPSASYISTEGVGGTLNVTAGKSYAVIKFQPTQAGYYTFTSNGDALTHIEIKSSDYYLGSALGNLADSDYKKGNSASIKVTADSNDKINPIYIGIAVKSDEAVTFDVIIKQINKINNIVTNVSAPANLADAEKPEGDLELANIPMSAESKIVPGDDGYYHYGDENGAIVYVLITESLDTLESGAALAYFEMSENAPLPYVYDVTTSEALESTTAGNSYKDYRLFIRGFKDYDYTNGMQGPVPVLPSELEQPNCYANHVNEDGAYPLTDELKEFLQNFANYNNDVLKWSLIDYEADSEYYWMFALYYYTEATEADSIVGTYKFVSCNHNGDSLVVDGEETTDDLYTLEVTKNRFTIYVQSRWGGMQEELSGTWTKDGDTYTFIEPDGTVDSNWTLIDREWVVEFDSSTGNIKLSYEMDDEEFVFQKI